MWEDSIIKEVRQTRLEIERECDDDFHKIYERALEIQKRLAAQKILDQKAQNGRLPVAA